MDWGAVGERLIRRGELLLSLDFLDDYELSLLNDGKVGRPFKITIVFPAVVRYLFSMPYRQIEGFTGALHRLPTVDYSWARRLRLDLSPYKSLSIHIQHYNKPTKLNECSRLKMEKAKELSHKVKDVIKNAI